MKTCIKCGWPKPLDAFYADRKQRDGHRARCKQCVSEDAAIHAERNRRYRARNPGKGIGRGARPANNKVQNELRRGRLKRPDHCEVCSVPYKVHAHHPDYSQPLLIMWVCRKCHKALHDAIAAQKEADHADTL